MGQFHDDIDRIPYILAGYADPFSAPQDLQRRSEFRAWSNSLGKMSLMLRTSGVSEDCGVLIEYRLPTTSRRIDFIITGHDDKGKANFVIIELKQWSEVEPVFDKPGIVIANTGGYHKGQTPHPSYQAWSYKLFLDNMLESVPKYGLTSYACAYMHNYLYRGAQDPIALPPNAELVAQTPVFGRQDTKRLGRFVKAFVGRGDGEDVLEKLTDGRLVPSQSLIQTVGLLFDKVAPHQFILLDDQKVAYETVLSIVSQAKQAPKRRVVIVEGGPGTGKSVVAITLLVQLLRREIASAEHRNIRFVSPTASFRAAMIEMLCRGGTGRQNTRLVASKKSATHLFCGSSAFFAENEMRAAQGFTTPTYQVLIVDEAHRLRSRQNMYRGKNQIEDIVRATKVAGFFVDDNQALRPDDIGSKANIERVASQFQAEVDYVSLTAQFRCSGAEGFINWLGDVFGLSTNESANLEGWDRSSFDFDIVDSPQEVVRYVQEINERRRCFEAEPGHSVIRGARMLAGYAWPWTKDNNDNAEIADVTIGEVKLPWNNRRDSSRWAIQPHTRNEVGCVHRAQGLEFEYVGVFIGPDLRYDPQRKCLYTSTDWYFDVGGKSNLGKDKAIRDANLLKYVCRCYRVLLSRGIRGARVYCCDAELASYLKKRLRETINLSPH